MIEKHELTARLGKKENIPLGQHQPSLLEEAGEARIAAAEGDDAKDKTLVPEDKEEEAMPKYNSLHAVTYLLFNMKALTPLLVSFTNGFIVAGKSPFRLEKRVAFLAEPALQVSGTLRSCCASTSVTAWTRPRPACATSPSPSPRRSSPLYLAVLRTALDQGQSA